MCISFRRLICACAFALVLGCSKECPVDASPLKFVSTPADVVFVEVNGRPLTFGMMRDQLKFEESVRRIASEKNGTKNEDAIHNFVVWRRTSLPPEMINTILLDEEAKRQGIVADAKQVGERLSTFLNGLDIVSEQQFAEKAELQDGFLRSMTERDVRRDMLLEKLYPDIQGITKSDEEEVLRRFSEFNERAAATNAVQRDTCRKIISEIDNGLDFKAAYEKYNQVTPLAGDTCEWGDFFKLDLKDNEKLADWAFRAPIGSVGGPFEWEDGYCVLKIVSRTDGTEEDSMASAAVASVHLQKITLLFSESLAVPDEKALRKHISDARRQESLGQLLGKLHETMELRYPHGNLIEGAD